MSAKRTQSHVSKLLKLTQALERTASDHPRPGFGRNVWSTYWDQSIAEEIVQLMTSYAEEERATENWFSAATSLAGFLRAALLLDRARETCLAIIDAEPTRAFVAMKELAYIDARAGDWDGAQEWARKANSATTSAFYKVVEEDLLREFENWKRLGVGAA